ncbi:MAG: response regulator [Bacteriovorax sp.]|jgi:CheY-like chemotaxis protein
MKKKLSILVIDDEVALKDIYTSFLGKMGAEVNYCDHPQKGWQAIDKEEYDLIITDLKMPVISGEEFISIVRSSKLNAHTPIILCSGHINKLIITEMARESKIYFLSKPFDSATLLDLVKKTLGVKQSGVVDNQALNEKWLQAFSKKMSTLTGEQIKAENIDTFEQWNFETISLHFSMFKEFENLNVTLLMKLKTFLKLAGKIQGTQYKEIEPEILLVWQDLLNNMFKVSGKVTFSKVISQEFIALPEQKTSFYKFNSSLGEVLAYLN